MSATELLVATITVDEALAQKGVGWLADSGSPYAGVDAIDLPDSVLDQVFALYKASYARLPSEPPGTPTFNIQDARALLEYDRFVLITAPESTIVGFVMAKTTAYGVKICATGQNGSREARAAILAFHIDALNTDGVYAEISPPSRRQTRGACGRSSPLGRPLANESGRSRRFGGCRRRRCDRAAVEQDAAVGGHDRLGGDAVGGDHDRVAGPAFRQYVAGISDGWIFRLRRDRAGRQASGVSAGRAAAAVPAPACADRSAGAPRATRTAGGAGAAAVEIEPG